MTTAIERRAKYLSDPAATSQTIRDQVEDHLLTPKNSVLIIIDYQPVQVGSVASMDAGPWSRTSSPSPGRRCSTTSQAQSTADGRIELLLGAVSAS